MQHSKHIEDLVDFTIIVEKILTLEEAFSCKAKSFTSDYNCCTQWEWESIPLEESWVYLLNTSEKFNVDGIMVNSKTFSYLVNHSVFNNIITMYEDMGLEEDRLTVEAHHILETLMNSIEVALNEEERFQFYKLID